MGRKFLAVLAFCLLGAGSSMGGTLNLLGAGPGAAAGGGGGSCPFVDDNGCAAAPANGSAFQSNFFTSYAAQSGQTFITRPPYNVAGVDYAIGAPTTGTYCDVQNAAACAATSGALPTGCLYTPTGNPAGGPQVSCTGVHNVTFDHWDFNASGTCTYLTATNTGSMTVTSSKFAWSNTCNLTSLISFSSGNLTSLTMTSNTIDGCSSRDQSVCYQWLTNIQASQFILWNTTKNTPIVMTYNAFYWAPPRIMNIGTTDTGDVNFKYNYIEGLQPAKAKFTATIDDGSGLGITPGKILCVSGAFDYGTIANGNTVFALGMIAGSYALTGPGTSCPLGAASWTLPPGVPNQAITARTMYVSSSNHGDTIINTMAAGKTRVNYNLVGNTYLSLPTNLANTGDWIRNIAGGGATSVITNLLIDHNTSVDNIGIYSNRAISSAVVYSSPAFMTTTNMTVTNNYAGVTGALTCYNLLPASGVTLAGNVILENASSWNAIGLANCVGHGS